MTLAIAKKVLADEAEGILRAAERLERSFSEAVDLICRCKGKVVITGIGKSGYIAQKISATLSSTGTPSLFLHAAEALHGDLGRISADDIVVVFSNSGETDEIVGLIPFASEMGARMIGVTGNVASTLAKSSDVFLDSSVEQEACPLGLAPTTSTTVMLALGDALAVSAMRQKGVSRESFSSFHPGGALGKRILLRVRNVMRDVERIAVVRPEDTIKSVLVEMTSKRSGAACVVDEHQYLIGIFTDGDLRRKIDIERDLLGDSIKKHMTERPLTLDSSMLVVEALKLSNEYRIDDFPVIDDYGFLIGLLDVQDIIDIGL